jgi:hypothetical protein
MHEWLPTHWWVSFGELLRDPIAWDALGRGLLTAGRLRPGLTGSPRGRGSPARTSRADAGTGSAAAGSRRHLVVVAAGSALQVARLPRRGRTPAPFPRTGAGLSVHAGLTAAAVPQESSGRLDVGRGAVGDRLPGGLEPDRTDQDVVCRAQTDADAVFDAGRLNDRAGSATKQSLTDATPNISSSMRCRASRLGASQMQIARLTSSCVTLPRRSKPGGNSGDLSTVTESQAARSRIVCTTPRCMTPSSTFVDVVDGDHDTALPPSSEGPPTVRHTNLAMTMKICASATSEASCEALRRPGESLT